MNKETVEQAAEQYAQGNTLEFAYLQEIPAFKAGAEWQKQQSTTDAIEFAEWLSSKGYVEAKQTTPNPKMWSIQSNLSKPVSTKELYELWKKSK
jgi:hypothetical protein